MQEPILQALTFSLDNELNLNPGLRAGTEGGGATGNVSCHGSASLNLIRSDVVLNLNQPVPCIFPGCEFVSTPVKEPGKLKESNLLEHFLCVHHFVLDRAEEVADIKRYLAYWREKFQEGKLLDYCVAILMDRPLIYESSKQEMFKTQFSGANGDKSVDQEVQDENKFFMLTALLPEDKALREKLWNERLEAILEVNRLEREDTEFSKQCLFCKEICTGNRKVIFQHMADSHGFHIGQPDNVVFVNEFIDCLNDLLNRMLCIYCGKTFKDKAVLREHMRKKQHRRINASNGEYDKFYIINYLEPGKTWKALDEEDPEDERREEEWIETRSDDTSIVCLLCSQQKAQFDMIQAHMKEDHHFDFVRATVGFDFYQKVKLVNYIRRNFYQNMCFLCEKRFFERTSLVSHVNQHLKDSKETITFDSKLWDRPEFFFPTYENDQFLIMLDQDSEESRMETEDTHAIVIPEDIPALSSTNFSHVDVTKLSTNS